MGYYRKGIDAIEQREIDENWAKKKLEAHKDYLRQKNYKSDAELIAEMEEEEERCKLRKKIEKRRKFDLSLFISFFSIDEQNKLYKHYCERNKNSLETYGLTFEEIIFKEYFYIKDNEY